MTKFFYNVDCNGTVTSDLASYLKSPEGAAVLQRATKVSAGLSIPQHTEFESPVAPHSSNSREVIELPASLHNPQPGKDFCPGAPITEQGLNHVVNIIDSLNALSPQPDLLFVSPDVHSAVLRMKENSVNYGIACLKVKIKSLAEEARIIRREERKALRHEAHERRHAIEKKTALPYPYVSARLQAHRTVNVREEQRATLFAYAILRKRDPWLGEQRVVTTRRGEREVSKRWRELSVDQYRKVEAMVKKYGDAEAVKRYADARAKDARAASANFLVPCAEVVKGERVTA